MDARCHIELFGTLRVTQGLAAHTRFRSPKAAALLSYLALSLPHARSREHLIELFWPDKESDVGRNNLSTTLSQLRRQLEPTGVPAKSVLVADHQQVRLNPDAVSTDLQEFDNLLQQVRRASYPTSRLPLLQRLLELYRGELLPGCYEDWAIREQNRCRAACLEMLEMQTETLEECGNLTGALAATQRRIEADPYEETAYLAQMRLHLLLDRPANALETFRCLEKLYRKELNTQPSPETYALAEQIRNSPRARPPASSAKSRLNARSALAVARTVAAVIPAEVLPSPATELVPPPLPLQLTRLFGRELEQEALCRRFQDPHTRLLTLLGTGGVGKTRLSVAVAEQLLPTFSGRIWFVSLAEVPDPSLIPYALLNALKLPPAVAASDPFEYVVEALGAEPCLLLLDNFEHLLRETPEPGKSDQAFEGSGPALVRLLLSRVPELAILVTSRQALRLAGEQEFALSPLPVPTREACSAEVLLENASVALYTDRARAVKPDFNLSTGNVKAVAQLCRMLEGVPLSLEMAAAWTRTLPPQGLVERLERQLTLLVSRQRDLPVRHRSLRATIEWSYDLLAPRLQECFVQLGVFRGGWTLAAAETLCGEDALEALSELQERSLVWMEEREAGEARYRLLEPLREFALEQLQAIHRIDEALRDHAAYFLALSEKASEQLMGADQGLWLMRLEADHDNLRAAMEGKDKETNLRVAGALWRFWDIHGHYAEGRMRLRTALEATADEAYPSARATALNGAGVLALRQGDYAFARRMYEECLLLSRKTGNKGGIANSLGNLGLISYEQGEYSSARALQEECLAICREMGNNRGIAATLGNLGNVVVMQEDYLYARTLLEESVSVNQELGNKWGMAASLNGLGNVALSLGDYAAARTMYAECLTIMKEMGDKGSILACFNSFATLAIKTDSIGTAVRLWSAENGIREAIGSPIASNINEEREAEVASAREAMGDDLFTIAWNEGRAMTMEQAIAYATEPSGVPPPE